MKPIAHKRFSILLTNELYWSKAYQSLTLSARNLLWCMVAELRFTGSRKKKTFAYTNNGKLSFTETEFKKQGLGSSATYIKARDRLIEVGLIKRTYRGGFARGDMNTYKLLFVEGIPQLGKRWKKYPKENWKEDLRKPKSYLIGVSTRFKKKNNTLKNNTHKCTSLPKELEASKETSLNVKGVTSDL